MKELKKPTIEMFDPKTTLERIGDSLKKNSNLEYLREVEEYFINGAYERGYEASYDVTANEDLNFRTFGYTEWAGSFLAFPLSTEVRHDNIREAIYSPEPIVDYAAFLEQRAFNNQANKYENRKRTEVKARENLVILLGTNKLKDVVELNKLIEIKRKGNVWFKPHPLTTHEYVGMLMDKLGEENVLPRDADMYQLMNDKRTKKVYSTHFSESVVYALILGKQLEPVDMSHKKHTAGFWHLNDMFFKLQFSKNYRQIVNGILSCSRSGVFNPKVDKDWKQKMDIFLDYHVQLSENYKGWYWDRRKEGKRL